MFGLLRVATGATVAADNASDVVAEIGGHKVTRAELEQKKAAKLFQARNQLYIAERDALNQFIDDQLLEEKAQAEHLSVEQLVQRDIISHISDPTEDQLQVYYEGLGTDEPFATVREKILGHIHELRVSKARSEYLKDLRNQFSVLVTLSPPSAHVSLEGAEIRGPKNPSVTLIEFADYECPYCQQIHAELKKLMQQFDGKMAFAFKDCPLPMHRRAGKAAEAARCAGDQEAFWEYHDLLFENGGKLEVAQLKEYARTLKLDTGRFDKCLDSGAQTAVVQKGLQEAKELGISGTPSFFINGHFFSGVVKYEDLRGMVEKELAGTIALKKD
ncbi:MAG: thioredoxin domain-containing protein [Bryobacteraceae bacterium]|jgi:predicted DsbA family dithiol-disulfide isomerase